MIDSRDFSQLSMLEAALRYIAMGWPVFPLQVRGKLPMIAKEDGGKGCEDATLNESKVREWWGKWPKANIGLATGHRHFVLDNDPKHNGNASLEFFAQHHGPLPKTIEQVTGSGGVHYLYAWPDFRVRNSQGKVVDGKLSGLAEGLDIRGYHGYIVGAPSIHPDTGIAYAWLKSELPLEEQKIAEAPAWLLDWLRKHAAKAEAPANVAPEAAEKRWPKGARHPNLIKFAGHLRRRNLGAEEMFHMLLVLNQTRCDPPYDAEHIRKMAEWIARRPADSRFDLFSEKAMRESQESPECDTRAEIAIGPADVEAAVDERIAADDLVGVIRLAPELAKIRPQFRAVIKAKIKDRFQERFTGYMQREFDRAIADAEGTGGKVIQMPPPAPPDGGDGGVPLPPGGGPDLRYYPLTEAGNSERMAALFGEEIRYCIEMKQWLVWDNKRWAVDAAGVITQKYKQMTRLLYAQAVGNGGLEKFARESEAMKHARATLAYTQSHPGIPISASDLDQQPYLLNCPNGVVDLKTKKLLPHAKEFLITKLCPVEYHEDAVAPLFQGFVEWAMGANTNSDAAELSEATVGLVGFLQRALGYSLTSDTAEKAVFVCYGEKGNNGKTTLLTLIRDLLGKDYSGQIAMETIMAAKQQDATMRADMADLRGCRFAVTSEVEKEQKVSVRTIKYLTAGMSEIKSCRKYENPIEFRATHHLWMDCNHRPRVTDEGDAIWKRLKAIPFNVRIDDSELDLQLPDKLRAELPGILAWVVRGCLAWQKNGLGEPPEVLQASLEWREHDDPLKDFLEDCCEVGEGLFVPSRDLTTAYEFWAKREGVKATLGRENFGERLRSKGFTQGRKRMKNRDGSDDDSKQFRAWIGLQLTTESAALVRKFITREGKSEPED